MQSIESFWETSGTRGEGARIALLDTGVDATHPGFEHRLIEQYNAVNPSAQVIDDDGHGTHCAGVLFQVAPACTLLSAKILTRSGMFSDDALQAGLRWANRAKADVVCICTGSRLAEPDTEDLIADLRSRNILTVAAIGNSGSYGVDAGIFPARYPSVLAVGSTDPNGELSPYTSLNAGKQVFCLAGEDVRAEHLDHGFAELSGTSVAAARLSGYLALVVAKARKESIDITVDKLLHRIELASEKIESTRGAYRRVKLQLLF